MVAQCFGDARTFVELDGDAAGSSIVGSLHPQSAAGHGRITLLQATVKNGGITAEGILILSQAGSQSLTAEKMGKPLL